MDSTDEAEILLTAPWGGKYYIKNDTNIFPMFDVIEVWMGEDMRFIVEPGTLKLRHCSTANPSNTTVFRTRRVDASGKMTLVDAVFSGWPLATFTKAPIKPRTPGDRMIDPEDR